MSTTVLHYHVQCHFVAASLDLSRSVSGFITLESNHYMDIVLEIIPEFKVEEV
jgi:hypothetical protein